MKKDNKGFTLIELLVVIAIIGILATVVTTNLSSARMKGRDAKRLSDIKELQKALDLYSDSCGGYPLLGDSAYVDIGAGGLTAEKTDDGCPDEMTFATYMVTLPVNPSPGGITYQYCSTPDDLPVGSDSCSDVATEIIRARTSYQVTFQLEGTNGSVSGEQRYAATPSGFQLDP